MASFTEEEAQEIGERLGIVFTDDPEEADEDILYVDEFRKGLVIEQEHGPDDPDTDVTHGDLEITAKIAWAHLKEVSDYYTRLEEAGLEDDV